MKKDHKNNENLANQYTIMLAVIIILLTFSVILLLYIVRNNNDGTINKSEPSQNKSSIYSGSSTPNPINEPKPKGTCKDVTSYDHNWNNDMICYRPDGSIFYTNYEGARQYLKQFE